MFSSLFTTTVYLLVYTGVVVGNDGAKQVTAPVAPIHVVERFRTVEECVRMQKELMGNDFLSYTQRPNLRCYWAEVSIFR